MLPIIAGHKMVAWHPKSSELNERSTVVIETGWRHRDTCKAGRRRCRRRIVTISKMDLDIKQGDDLAFIKFGSRVDIFLPVGTEIEVPISSGGKGKQNYNCQNLNIINMEKKTTG